MVQKLYVLLGGVDVIPSNPPDPAILLAGVKGVLWDGANLGVERFANTEEAATSGRSELRLQFDDTLHEIEKKLVQVILWKFTHENPQYVISEHEVVIVGW